jgi:hypothetical protein
MGHRVATFGVACSAPSPAGSVGDSEIRYIGPSACSVGRLHRPAPSAGFIDNTRKCGAPLGKVFLRGLQARPEAELCSGASALKENAEAALGDCRRALHDATREVRPAPVGRAEPVLIPPHPC